MSAYNRGELSIEAYLVRLLAAACRKNGGELRLKGEDIDHIGEATALLKSWDSATQEVVLTVSLGTYGEVFKVVPEKQTQSQFIFPRPSEEHPDAQPTRTGSTILDDDKLAKLERSLTKRRVAAMIADEMKRRSPQGGQS